MVIYKQESYDIIGAAFDVYNKLGHGFLEAVYQEAFGIELKKRGIPYEREKEIKILYDSRLYKPSLLFAILLLAAEENMCGVLSGNFV